MTAIEGEGVAALVPDILFTSVEAIFQSIDAKGHAEGHEHPPPQRDCLVIGDVSPDHFQKIEAERDRRGRRFRLFYLQDRGCIIITIPTRQHEVAHRWLFAVVTKRIDEMGLDAAWYDIGSTTFKSGGPASGGGSGEGDSTGQPSTRSGVDGWPTLVVESGVSQIVSSLHTRARWWFFASSHSIKVVVLVKVSVATSTIYIEKWTEAPPPSRSGATTTRMTTRAALLALQPVCEQNIAISWSGRLPIQETLPRSTDFDVEGAPLVIRFEELFDRAPVPTAGEHDVLVSEVDLQDLATRVWKFMM